MNLIKIFREWRWKRQREFDMQILWPACKENAPTMDMAKAAFAVHAYRDPAWIEFYGPVKLFDVIQELK